MLLSSGLNKIIPAKNIYIIAKLNILNINCDCPFNIVANKIIMLSITENNIKYSIDIFSIFFIIFLNTFLLSPIFIIFGTKPFQYLKNK